MRQCECPAWDPLWKRFRLLMLVVDPRQPLRPVLRLLSSAVTSWQEIRAVMRMLPRPEEAGSIGLLRVKIGMARLAVPTTGPLRRHRPMTGQLHLRHTSLRVVKIGMVRVDMLRLHRRPPRTRMLNLPPGTTALAAVNIEARLPRAQRQAQPSRSPQAVVQPHLET